MKPYAYEERLNLTSYTERESFLLSHDAILAEANNGIDEHKIYWSISELAANLVQVGEDDAALDLVEELLHKTRANEDGILRVWSSLAEKGAKIADSKLRDAMGLSYDEHGNTLLGDAVDDINFFPLLSLYKLGDATLIPHLHRMIEDSEESNLVRSVRLAVRLYQTGDESAYQLIIDTAKKARSYAISQDAPQQEPSADDASDFKQLISGVTQALTPPRSTIGSSYVYADISLSYFARDLLVEGDVQRADEIAELLISGFDSAWINALKFKLGYDPDGHFLQAAKDYLAIQGDDAGSHALRIASELVCGGDSDAIADYEAIYDQSITEDTVDELAAVDILTALHLSGDTRAHDRLIELIQDPDDAWMLEKAFEDMGLPEEALRIAKSEFTKQPDALNGLRLLNLQYDDKAMAAVQNGIDTYDRSSIDVIYGRAKRLGRLATHIVAIEQGLEDKTS
jgi:hypothetical protein